MMPSCTLLPCSSRCCHAEVATRSDGARVLFTLASGSANRDHDSEAGCYITLRHGTMDHDLQAHRLLLHGFGFQELEDALRQRPQLAAFWKHREGKPSLVADSPSRCSMAHM